MRSRAEENHYRLFPDYNLPLFRIQFLFVWSGCRIPSSFPFHLLVVHALDFLFPRHLTRIDTRSKRFFLVCCVAGWKSETWKKKQILRATRMSRPEARQISLKKVYWHATCNLVAVLPLPTERLRPRQSLFLLRRWGRQGGDGWMDSCECASAQNKEPNKVCVLASRTEHEVLVGHPLPPTLCKSLSSLSHPTRKREKYDFSAG